MQAEVAAVADPEDWAKGVLGAVPPAGGRAPVGVWRRSPPEVEVLNY